MELEELARLEDKVKHLVDNLKHLEEENERLKLEAVEIKKESSLRNEERLEIKKKVAALIELIESIEK